MTVTMVFCSEGVYFYAVADNFCLSCINILVYFRDKRLMLLRGLHNPAMVNSLGFLLKGCSFSEKRIWKLKLTERICELAD